jgi:hypothetical protein
MQRQAHTVQFPALELACRRALPWVLIGWALPERQRLTVAGAPQEGSVDTPSRSWVLTQTRARLSRLEDNEEVRGSNGPPPTRIGSKVAWIRG